MRRAARASTWSCSTTTSRWRRRSGWSGWSCTRSCRRSAQPAAACCKDLFDRVGGLSLDFPVNYNDVDYCLKLRAEGKRTVYDPDLVMNHFESSSRSPDVADWEKSELLARWASVTTPDPYSNPYLREGMPRVSAALQWAQRRPRLPRRLKRGRIAA